MMGDDGRLQLDLVLVGAAAWRERGVGPDQLVEHLHTDTFHSYWDESCMEGSREPTE